MAAASPDRPVCALTHTSTAAMEFKAMQAALLREKEEAMKLLGAADLSARFDSAAEAASRAVPRAARGKAKAKPKVEVLDASLLRRSTR